LCSPAGLEPGYHFVADPPFFQATPVTDRLSLSSFRPATPWSRPRLALLDCAALIGLALLALVIRVPSLLTVPRFTDEQLEVLYTLPLYRHQALPLVGFDPYTGPVFSYLLAALFWVVGPQPYVPRVLVLLIGVATVAAVYLLGRSVGGRLAGLIAAGLLATSATHVLVNSHIAWSNSMTPLFTTLAFATVMPAVTRRSGPRLAAAGLVFAIALQTHPTVIAFLPGVILALLWRHPRLLLGGWGLLAMLLLIAGYSNVLIYTLPGRGEDPYRLAAGASIPGWSADSDETHRRLLEQRQSGIAGQAGVGSYLANLGAMAHNLPRLAGSIVEERPNWTDYLLDATFWLYAALFVVGLVWPLGRANPLPLLATSSYVVALMFFNGRYEPIFSGRYLVPLLPLAFSGFGTLVADVWSEVSGQVPRLVLASIVVLLIAYPLLPLLRYLQHNGQDGQVDVDLIQSAATLAAARRTTEPLVLDEALGRHSLPGGGDLLMSLQVFLELRNAAYEIGAVTSAKVDGMLGDARTAMVVFALPYDRDLEVRFRFIPVDDRGGARYAAYRLERRS
jgi:4-amino-4-deoxy-L-arabinose transferase-like glycosyltransferase